MALHKNARTTPDVRAEIASSTASAASLAQRFGITEATIYKWKKRTSFQDGSSPAHRLRTTLTPAQERVGVELRRHGVSNLNALKPATPRETHKSFKSHALGFRGESDPGHGAPADPTRNVQNPWHGRTFQWTHRSHHGQDLERSLMRYVALYNHQQPQSARSSKAPIQPTHGFWPFWRSSARAATSQNQRTPSGNASSLKS